jgi:excisionase family DNA binding protein
MKKVTFNTLPEAISELLDRVERIEQILGNKPRMSQSKTVKTKKSKSQGPLPDKLTVKEAGKFLNLSLVTLYSYIKNNKIPFEKQGRRLFSLKRIKKSNQNGPIKPVRTRRQHHDKRGEKLLNVPSSTLYYFIKPVKLGRFQKAISCSIPKGTDQALSKKKRR